LDDKRLEYIILYTLTGSAGIIIAALARLSALKLGADGFTANVIFIIFIAIALSVYLSIQLVLKNWMIPLIEKVLMQIPYFGNRNTISLPLSKLEEVRKENTIKKEKKLKDAISYTQKVFAPYVTDHEINRLCDYIALYAKKSELKSIKPIQINNQLTSLDIYHFGWNIWNHFRIGKQDDIVSFLKSVFPHTLRDAEAETIKKHLKDDERKGIIKIQENITA
jgi:hypothetical protein